ncbi:hypothetical protein [Oricola sp.]|uniref:hypothetical protein n=1 Tax=Oricola sp. TaxID=1979950 RepID=UPI0025D81FBD|nr:hypothetical protein [Oricola sp.]MCI5074749.1 hypothetical protein [Oricola sp.]
MRPGFIIHAPPYTNRSSGVRALYRLCHHLNMSGHDAAMFVPGLSSARPLTPFRRLRRHMRSGFRAQPPYVVEDGWLAPLHKGGTVGDNIVIYPEVAHGNPLSARKVVRWLLHEPGFLGGDDTYPDNELVFVFDRQKLDRASRATRQTLGENRVLWTGLVDPKHIHPNGAQERDLVLTFEHKGKALAERFPLDETVGAVRLEDLTPDYAALGDILRRTRTLHSYDHYSNVLREAVICGCEVLAIDEAGRWHDPRHCDCRQNIDWTKATPRTYAQEFEDSTFVEGFVAELEREGYL